MQIGQVTLIGGSGFVGRHIAEVLCARGIHVVVPTRNRERAKRELIVLPTADVVRADVHSPADLDRVVAGADAVVNLVGILQPSGRNSFERVHVELPGKIVAACRRAGVKRLLHMSALGAAANAPSAYQRSKAEGEARVLQAAGDALAVTVFRPSVIFGSGDSLLNLFARMQRVLPIVLLGSPQAKFQPVWVEDVARAYAAALEECGTFGQRYELCGPSVHTLRELVALAGRLSGHPRPIIGLGKTLSYLQALALEFSPLKILTRDNLRSMSVDNVCGCAWPGIFGFAPSPLEVIAPFYLSHAVARRFDNFRARAGR
ncbi:MAG: NAD-dependent epimerase/dehydratase family protein [Betaproteobacteria bacterium]|nr:NAD-dependent epimerase/dehydratase family protein [Betaproteobacteria bacterium]